MNGNMMKAADQDFVVFNLSLKNIIKSSDFVPRIVFDFFGSKKCSLRFHIDNLRGQALSLCHKISYAQHFPSLPTHVVPLSFRTTALKNIL